MKSPLMYPERNDGGSEADDPDNQTSLDLFICFSCIVEIANGEFPRAE